MSEKWEAYHKASTLPPWETVGPASQLLSALCDGSLPTSGAAVELGCGSGTSTRALARAGLYPVIGVDISRTAIARATAATSADESFISTRVQWACADLLEPGGGVLAAWRGRCAVVFDLQVFHTFSAAQRDAVAASEAALLAPGGRLLVITGSDSEPARVEPGPARLSVAETEAPFRAAGLRLLRRRATRFDATPAYGACGPAANECLWEKPWLDGGLPAFGEQWPALLSRRAAPPLRVSATAAASSAFFRFLFLSPPLYEALFLRASEGAFLPSSAAVATPLCRMRAAALAAASSRMRPRCMLLPWVGRRPDLLGGARLLGLAAATASLTSAQALTSTLGGGAFLCRQVAAAAAHARAQVRLALRAGDYGAAARAELHLAFCLVQAGLWAPAAARLRALAAVAAARGDGSLARLVAAGRVHLRSARRLERAGTLHCTPTDSAAARSDELYRFRLVCAEEAAAVLAIGGAPLAEGREDARRA